MIPIVSENIPQTYAATKQTELEKADRQNVVHDVLRLMTVSEMSEAVMAHIQARPDVNQCADDLMEMSNQIGREAWKHM